jgi:hypothetical protein
MTGSWLSGPSAVAPGNDVPERYRGEQLGLPEHGVGSLAPARTRLAAIFVDWLIAVGIARLVVSGAGMHQMWQTMTLIVWFVIGVVAVWSFDYTPGQFFLRVRVARIDGPTRVGLRRALARSAMLVFVIPALFTDLDGRGMHDRATGTAVVRSR